MREYDLAGGNTNPETFPVADIARVAAKAITDLGGDLARYPGDLGHAGLRQLMAQREATREGIAVDPDHISLTNGSMQAVTLMAEALMDKPGEVIVVEELCYMGTLYAYKEVGARLVGIPLDEHGMRLECLEESLRQLHEGGTPPAFIYTTSTYQNPTGAVMPRARRLELIDLARRFDTIIVEDNCYADVHFEGRSSQLSTLSMTVRIRYMYARYPRFWARVCAWATSWRARQCWSAYSSAVPTAATVYSPQP